ncbi:arginyltransferase [Rhizobium sp. L1K21]|uniref:arginyltransferase n=1 Tax=Rhizobium sp. L1K21 TaxID=2954933 RepID=UPI00209378D5|nr:arginyltransferase [Rhizobium sp. L1K21]MCO6186468.1 arginyltransferase [Rhizobium sp. L1K21]
MNTQPNLSPQFYLTAPAKCPYLDALMERKVFTHLVGPKAPEINDLLTQGGFRRSQNIAYRPACESCKACVSVRILAGEFKPTRSMRRVLAANDDISVRILEAEPTNEQFALFRRYIDSRHQQGGMAEMNALDFSMMVEDTHVNTRLIEYRIRQEGDGVAERHEGQLVGVALTDMMSDGSSMVYSFFEPDMEKRSFGAYMILDHIRRAQEQGLPHVYLGYWVKGSRKMEYKTRYLPQEHLLNEGWTRYEGETT